MNFQGMIRPQPRQIRALRFRQRGVAQEALGIPSKMPYIAANR